MVLPSAGCPWKDHLLELEQEQDSHDLHSTSPPVKYVLFRDSNADSWRVQCVPKSKNSFENRSDSQAFHTIHLTSNSRAGSE